MTVVNKNLSFSWPTFNLSEWEKHPIMHNAGITDSMKDKYFYKASFGKLPSEIDGSNFDKNTCSYKYFQYVKEACKILNT